eukprot:2555043-Pleurochrysis_carterae.AAC.1
MPPSSPHSGAKTCEPSERAGMTTFEEYFCGWAREISECVRESVKTRETAGKSNKARERRESESESESESERESESESERGSDSESGSESESESERVRE